MSALAVQVEAALGVLQRDLVTFASYRTQIITQNLGVLFSLGLFYYVSRLVSAQSIGSPDDYFAFVVVGLVILNVMQAAFQSPGLVRQELVAGSFERILVSPFGPVGATLGLLLFPFVYSLMLAVLTLGLAALLFGMPLEWSTAAPALPVALLIGLAFAPFGLIFAGATLLFKQAPGTSWVLAGLSLVAGLYFPVSLLPDWLEWTSQVQPFTPAVELMRHLLVGLPLTDPAWLAVLKLAVFAAVALPATTWALSYAIRAARRRGTIIEY